MASTSELRRLLYFARRAKECARSYFGAQYRVTWHRPDPRKLEGGLYIDGPDFATSSDPHRAWARAWDNHCRAGANIARAEAASATTEWERAAAERAVAHYEGMHGSEAHLLETRKEEAGMEKLRAAAPQARAVAAPESRPPPAPAPEPAPVAQPRTGAELDFMDKSSAPALPPRRRSRVSGARTEPVEGGGGIWGKLVRG